MFGRCGHRIVVKKDSFCSELFEVLLGSLVEASWKPFVKFSLEASWKPLERLLEGNGLHLTGWEESPLEFCFHTSPSG